MADVRLSKQIQENNIKSYEIWDTFNLIQATHRLVTFVRQQGRAPST
jgi:hypothetical protein